MIQRIQTLYLFIAFLFVGVLPFFVPFFELNLGEPLNLPHTFSNTSTIIKSLGFVHVASAILCLIAVFSYKNRQNQFVINRVNILFNFYILGVLIYLSMNLPGETAISEKGIGMYFSIPAIVLLVMANKAIKKDEDLVKSVDRLR
ncbi:DUF4293 domain-containing protein [Ochrovirga pacifica]|uniref:DUF4293 domain-containing protein n=1 Tax=Ochrovirga pacifica TaxID=1042376 RepID=UPI000255872F|nr:DUF4293 domain-containing protein [Ochrovirga pacifica]